MPRLTYLLFVLPTFALAQSLMPSDVDLKTAYCIAPIKSNIKLGEGALPMYPPGSEPHQKAAKFAQQKKDDLIRASAYLVAKTPYLDVTGLMIAQKRGENDVESVSSDISQCVNACGSLDKVKSESELERWKSCFSQCDGGPAGKRVRACNTLDWLPY